MAVRSCTSRATKTAPGHGCTSWTSNVACRTALAPLSIGIPRSPGALTVNASWRPLPRRKERCGGWASLTHPSARPRRPIPLTTGRGFSPRLGPDYLLYVSSKGSGDVIWKLADGATTELWSGPEARIIGGPEIAPDGRRLAFSADQDGKTLLYVINTDGTNVRVVTDSLELRGAPAWTPDGRSITSAADVDGTPHLFNISLDGAATPLVRDYSVDPVWSPAGDFVVYSGADIGTTFAVKSVAANGTPHPVPDLTLTRGARRLRFLRGQRMLVVMRGDIQHKDLWQIDLGSGTERQLTSLPADVNVRDFDVSPDGREIVFEQVQEQSNVVLINLAPRD